MLLFGATARTFATDDRSALVAGPGSARLTIPVSRLDDLPRLVPIGPGMIAFGKQGGYRRFTLICRETNDPRHVVHLRNFAPAKGILEGPVTGTAHAVAAAYLDREGLLPPEPPRPRGADPGCQTAPA